VHQQRTWERLEQAADAGSSALLQHLAQTGERLRAITNLEPARRRPALIDLACKGGGCSAILLEGHALTLVPDRRLRFLPEA
jgi:hypothetical protein